MTPDELKVHLVTQIRSSPKGLAQVDFPGADKDEVLEQLRAICIPLAEELELQIWAQAWPFTSDVWVVKWRPNDGNPEL